MRDVTNKLVNGIDAGIYDAAKMAKALLDYMSEDEVRDFASQEGYIDEAYIEEDKNEKANLSSIALYEVDMKRKGIASIQQLYEYGEKYPMYSFEDPYKQEAAVKDIISDIVAKCGNNDVVVIRESMGYFEDTSIYDYKNGKAYFIGFCCDDDEREEFDTKAHKKAEEFLNDWSRYYNAVPSVACGYLSVYRNQFVLKVWDEKSKRWLVESIFDEYTDASNAELKSDWKDTLIEKCEW